MSPPDRSSFLLACEKEAENWNELNKKHLQDFFLTDTGRRVLGIMELTWKAKALATIGIAPNPEAPVLLAETQGHVRAIQYLIDQFIGGFENV